MVKYFLLFSLDIRIMMYRMLMILFSLSSRIFFSSFKIKGKENIPQNKPLLVVANHPSTFMDPIVMAVAMKRKVHFIAKGSAFKSRIARWILPKFNMIPIYRKDFEPGEMHKNDQTFEKVYEILEQGGAVIIFPEGISITDRILKKIRTGAMRMALGVEAKNNFSLNVYILPMGLNFSNPHKFRSKLEIRIGEPIQVSRYKEMYAQDSFKAVHALKNETKSAIENLIFCVDNPTTDRLIAQIESIYKRNFLDKTNREHLELHEEMEISELVHERVRYYLQNDPFRVTILQDLLNDHETLMTSLQLDGEIIDIVSNEKAKLSFDDVLFYISGLPVFLYGFINNILPYKIPGWIKNFVNARHDFTGAILMGSGTILFFLFYVFQTAMIYSFSSSWIIALVYLISLPFSGILAYNYYEKIKNHRHCMRYHKLKSQGNQEANQLESLEKAIVFEIESAIKFFDKFKLERAD